MIEVTTPPGRIVWGHPAIPSQKRDNSNKKVFNDDGTPKMVIAYGLAIPKPDFERVMWPAMLQEAMTGYPKGVPNGFSWKYKDGDGVDRKGVSYTLREGHAGCYVLAISSELPNAPPIFKFEGGAFRQIAANEIKCGDWVCAGVSLKVNVPTNISHTPGLYVNPLASELIGIGTAIVSQGSVDPNEMFANRQHQLPPGVSLTPMSGAGGAPMPGMGQQGGMPGQVPMGAGPGPQYAPQYAPQQPQYAPQPAPMQQQPAPAYDYTGQPAPQGAPGMPMQPQYAPQPQQQPQYAPQPAPMGMPGQMPMQGMMPPR